MTSSTRGGTHVFVNALSIGTGGGFTVALRLLQAVADHRPDWRFTVALIEGDEMQTRLAENEGWGEAFTVLWAPPQALGRWGRRRYERGEMSNWVRTSDVDVVFQLNGMVVPGIGRPTVAHFQDPWPFVGAAWEGPRDRVLAFAKRREIRAAVRSAAACTWTSHYLEELITRSAGTEPQLSRVIYNGVEPALRGPHDLERYEQRTPQIVSISTVMPHKRHEVVIRAMPQVIRTPGLEELRYRIAGRITPARHEFLTAVAAEVGVGSHVVIDGEVDETEKIDLLRSSQAFVLMSVCESFGIPAVEAMASGTPVVVTDCCAFPEICGDAALLVAPDDHQALAAQLSALLTDATAWEARQAAGRDRAERYPWDRSGALLAEALESVAG